MSKTLTKNVAVHNPEGGGTQWFGPDHDSAELPSELADQVTNPSVFADSNDEDAPAAGAYQRTQGVELDPDAGDTGDGPLAERKVAQLRNLAAQHDVDLEGARTKDDIVSALESAGVDDGSNDG